MSSASAILTPSRSLNSLNREELTKLCKEFSLKATGTNAALLQRLREHAKSLPPDAALSISANIPSDDAEPPQQLRSQYKSFVGLGLDIHLNILSHLQALDILSFGQCSRELAAVTKHRTVWTQAFKNALAMQHIPVPAYSDVLKNASIPTLKGMASIPARLSRKFGVGGTLTSYAQTIVRPPEGHKVDFFCISPDFRMLVMQSLPVKRNKKKTLSIWDLGADSGQLPVLRHQDELDDEKSLTSAMLLNDDGGGLSLFFLEHSKPDERIYLREYIYQYSEDSMEDTDPWFYEPTAPDSIRAFGRTLLLTWDGSVSLWSLSARGQTPDDPIYVDFCLPPKFTPFDNVHMSHQGLLIRKNSGYAVYSLPKEDSDEPIHPIISLEAPLGEILTFPSLLPLDLPPLPFDYQTAFIVDVSLQGHIRWCKISDITIGDVHIDCVPKYLGSTALPNHKLTGGSYVPWGDGFIATVRSPLAAVMVDESDPDKAYSLKFDISPNRINESTVFSPIHGNVYVLRQDKAGIMIYHLFRRPPPF